MGGSRLARLASSVAGRGGPIGDEIGDETPPAGVVLQVRRKRPGVEHEAVDLHVPGVGMPLQQLPPAQPRLEQLSVAGGGGGGGDRMERSATFEICPHWLVTISVAGVPAVTAQAPPPKASGP